MYRCHSKRALGKKISQNVRILINSGLLVGFSLVVVFYICNVCCDLLLGPEVFEEHLATKDTLKLIRTEELIFQSGGVCPVCYISTVLFVVVVDCSHITCTFFRSVPKYGIFI